MPNVQQALSVFYGSLLPKKSTKFDLFFICSTDLGISTSPTTSIPTVGVLLNFLYPRYQEVLYTQAIVTELVSTSPFVFVKYCLSSVKLLKLN